MGVGYIILILIVLTIFILHGFLYLNLDDTSSNYEMQFWSLIGSGVSVAVGSMLGGFLLKKKKVFKRLDDKDSDSESEDDDDKKEKQELNMKETDLE